MIYLRQAFIKYYNEYLVRENFISQYYPFHHAPEIPLKSKNPIPPAHSQKTVNLFYSKDDTIPLTAIDSAGFTSGTAVTITLNELVKFENFS